MSEHLRGDQSNSDNPVEKRIKLSKRPRLLTKAVALFGGLALVLSCSALSPVPVSSDVQTNTIHLSSCTEITQSGNYVLDEDLADPESVSGSCFLIHDTNDVYFNCNSHSIFMGADSQTTIGFYIQDAKNINLNSCTIASAPFGSSLTFYKVEKGSITSSYFSQQSVALGNSSSILVRNNIFDTSDVGLSDTQNSIIDNNQFIVSKDSERFKNNSLSAFIGSSNGTSNSIVNNYLDGGSDGIFANKSGMDDGIVLGLGSEYDTSLVEDHNLVHNNTIRNVYDCGIETEGLIINTAISNNFVENTGYCGIGAWYVSSWRDNTVSDNIASWVPSLFKFHFEIRDPYKHTNPLYFVGNRFIRNKLVNQKINPEETGFNYQPNSIFFDYYTERYSGSQKPNFDKIHFVTGNNKFTENDLGISASAYFVPGSMIVDGGGNICKPETVSYFPLTCKPAA